MQAVLSSAIVCLSSLRCGHETIPVLAHAVILLLGCNAYTPMTHASMCSVLAAPAEQGMVGMGVMYPHLEEQGDRVYAAYLRPSALGILVKISLPGITEISKGSENPRKTKLMTLALQTPGCRRLDFLGPLHERLVSMEILELYDDKLTEATHSAKSMLAKVKAAIKASTERSSHPGLALHKYLYIYT